MISTRCWTPTGRSSMSASGSTWKPNRSEISWTRRRASAQVDQPAAADGLVAEDHVLRDGEDRDEHEVLVDHADAGGHRVAGPGERHGRVVDEDLALVGVVQPVEDVHQRGLAGAVLAEQRVDLARARRRGRCGRWRPTTRSVLVMPCSSSFTGRLLRRHDCGLQTLSIALARSVLDRPTARALGPGRRPAVLRQITSGTRRDSTSMSPEMIGALSSSSSS